MSTQPKPYVTPEQYLEMDRKSEGRIEYFDGEIFPVSAGTLSHVRITRNVLVALDNQLRGRSCEVTGTNLRVQTRANGPYFYPDIVVFRGKPQFAGEVQDMIRDATVIIEVLSPSTEDYDRGSKFVEYRKLPSLTDYILVGQDRIYLEHHRRQGEGFWLMYEATDAGDLIRLPSIECSFHMSDLYERVEFESEAAA